MVGVLITLLFAIGAMGVGQFLVGRWTKDLDVAESAGVNGMIGLGALGLLTLFIGLVPDGLKWGVGVVALIAAAGYVPIVKSVSAGSLKFAKPQGASLLFVLALSVAVAFALVSVLAPSDANDWDTLAYHLAAPKIWMQAGQIQYVPFIHQSNFPFTVENLFIWGLTWGGQSGAKAFTLAFFIFGLIAIFGVARGRYGVMAGWWASLAFATVPVVLWESGTGYIDVPHGIFGGLGVLYAARTITEPKDRSSLWLSAILLGFAAGTKYTGLQTIAVVALVLVAAFVIRKQAVDGLKTALLVGLVAMAVAAPWYVKTVTLTGNPVFPFFYEHFGGKNWDQRRADVYRVEQQHFGAGTLETRHNPTELGNAVLGLVYMPGRYVNPGEDSGNGTPLGAVGAALVVVALLWMLSGRLGSYETSVLGVVGFSLLMWFFLSQQSRYVVPLLVPLAVLAGGAVHRLKMGKVLAGIIVAQAGYSLWLVYSQRFDMQIQAVLGKVSAEDFQSQTIGFYDASLEINKEAAGGKVALYDEVFGYLLDVPYVWANPPHSMIIPYDSLHDGASYAAEMKKLGFTHIYISTSSIIKDKELVKIWIDAMGLKDPPVPFTDEVIKKYNLRDWQNEWMILLAEAVAQHLIQPVKGFKHGILFKVM